MKETFQYKTLYGFPTIKKQRRNKCKEKCKKLLFLENNFGTV